MNRIASYFERELRKSGHYEEVAGWNVYVGDIHNHCGISYGYGSIENAIAFAKNQLDFFSVTGHFAWPDMVSDTSKLIPPEVIAYHREGFQKLRKNWPHYLTCMKESETEDCIPFPSFEYHSFEYGDYTILCRSIDEKLPDPVPDDQADVRLKVLLSGDESQQEKFLCIPHHIGYRTGYRGINWRLFNARVSPLVEIVSMHGCAESLEAKNRYLHTMGPRYNQNTYQGGLKQGHHFGVVGSTDHHNAAPGSYGFGRTVLYADRLDRNSVWNALCNRNTAAATGDPIQTLLYANGTRAGLVAPRHNGTIQLEAYVAGYDKLEKVEIIQGSRVIAGKYLFDNEESSFSGFVSFMFGWGKKHNPAIWDIEVWAENGTICDSSPRIRGIDMVDPLDTPNECSSHLPRYSFVDKKVRLHLITNGNTTATTDTSSGFVLDIEGRKETLIRCKVTLLWEGSAIEKEYSYSLLSLQNGQQTEYLNGFVSPAIEVGIFRRRSECCSSIQESIHTDSQEALYLRAYQKNGDGVYTSPISFKG